MCPSSPLGSSRPWSRGQTQAVDRVYPHPKTDLEPQCRETGRVGRWDMDAPHSGNSHCWSLSPSSGGRGGRRLLALDLRAEWTLQPGGGARGWERARDWAVSKGTLLFPQSLSVSGSSGASTGSLQSVCLEPQAAQSHAIPSESNSSPRFPP